jgi:BASS family bile acid:Na+ symporter
MEASFVTTVLLPLALAFVMLGLGLELTTDDFRRVGRAPKAIAVGLGIQMLLLPAIAWMIAAQMEPELGLGLMLLAAAPGGPTANFYSAMAGGDVAFNLTLTAVNSVLAVVWVPLVVQASVAGLLGSTAFIPLQTAKIAETAAIVAVPVGIGMLVHARSPATAARIVRGVRVASVLLLATIVIGLSVQYRARIPEFVMRAGPPVLALNLLSLGTGWFVPRWLGLPARQAVAISLESGIHNGTLALAIALNVLNLPLASVPPALYSILAYFTAAAMAWWASRTLAADQNA